MFTTILAQETETSLMSSHETAGFSPVIEALMPAGLKKVSFSNGKMHVTHKEKLDLDVMTDVFHENWYIVA